MIIYCIENLITHKKYVGYSTKFNSEKEFQKCKYFGSGLYLKRSIKKYGKEKFKKWILLKNIFDFEELKRYEILWIKKLKTKHPNGYNLTDGGDGCKGCFSIHKKWKKENDEQSEKLKKYWNALSTKEKKFLINKRKIGLKIFYENETNKHKKMRIQKLTGIIKIMTNKPQNHGKARLGKKFPGQYKNRKYKNVCVSCKNDFVAKSCATLFCDECRIHNR